MKILMFNNADYIEIDQGPQNHIYRLPIINCGLDIDLLEFSHQMVMKTEGRIAAEAQAISLVEMFRPDVVIVNQAGYGQNLSMDVLQNIRSRGAKIISNIFDNTVIKDNGTIYLFHISDVFIVFDSPQSSVEFSILSDFLYNGEKVVVFGGGYFYHDLLPPPSATLEHDILFIGSKEGNRKIFLTELERRLRSNNINLKCLGGIIDTSLGHREIISSYLTIENYFNEISRAKITLNCQSDPLRQQVKGRVYEALGCGSLLLTDRTPDIDALFPDDILAKYSSVDDCVIQIIELLKDETRRFDVARRGRHWFVDNLDYKNFWSSVLLAAAGHKIPIPQPKGVTAIKQQVRESLYLLQAQLMDLVRCARVLGALGLGARMEQPYISIGSINSREIAPEMTIDNIALVAGTLTGGDRRATLLAGWGIHIE